MSIVEDNICLHICLLHRTYMYAMLYIYPVGMDSTLTINLRGVTLSVADWRLSYDSLYSYHLDSVGLLANRTLDWLLALLPDLAGVRRFAEHSPHQHQYSR